MNRFSGLVVKLAVAKRSSESSVSASPVFDSRLMHAFVATLSSLRFSGLVVKLAVAIWVTPRAASASPVFDSRLMQVSFLHFGALEWSSIYRLCGDYGDAEYARPCASFCFVGQSTYGRYEKSFSPCSALSQSHCFLFDTIYIQVVTGEVLKSFILIIILHILGPPWRYLLVESVTVVISSGEEAGDGGWVVDCTFYCRVI
jgi:hypothetical protein